MSEKPTSQVGSAAARASQSRRSTRSIAVSPPHGGTTHAMSGSASIRVSSAARCAAGAEVRPSRPCTPPPRPRTRARAASRRRSRCGPRPPPRRRPTATSHRCGHRVGAGAGSGADGPFLESDTLCPWVSVTSWARPSTPRARCRASTSLRGRPGWGPRTRSRCSASRRDAMTSAARHGRGVPGRANAMRHFMWQAVLTARFGVDAARAIAAAQEAGTPSRRDSRVDAHNNEVGQAYGAEHADDLRPLSPARRWRAWCRWRWRSGRPTSSSGCGSHQAVRPSRSCSPSGHTARTTPAAASALRQPGHGGSVM